MVFTDNIHLVADSLEELHDFAKKIGLKRSYFHGVRKKHPHYDLTNYLILKKAVENGATQITRKDILIKAKKIYDDRYRKNQKRDLPAM